MTTTPEALCPWCSSPHAGPGACPTCGREAPVAGATQDSAWSAGGVLSPVKRYFHDLGTILFRPTAFFRRMPITGGLARPLAFALVTHWVGSAFKYLWIGSASQALMSIVDRAMQMNTPNDIDTLGKRAVLMSHRDQFMQWTMGAGSVVLDPFTTLISILFTAFFVYLGARLLVTPSKDGAPAEITFESAARIVAYGMSPAILAGIPFLGPVIASIWVAVATVIAAREVYRIQNGRAVAVALFPKILFFGIMMFGFAVLAIVFFKFISMMF